MFKLLDDLFLDCLHQLTHKSIVFSLTLHLFILSQLVLNSDVTLNLGELAFLLCIFLLIFIIDGDLFIAVVYRVQSLIVKCVSCIVCLRLISLYSRWSIVDLLLLHSIFIFIFDFVESVAVLSLISIMFKLSESLVSGDYTPRKWIILYQLLLLLVFSLGFAILLGDI